MWLIGLIVIAIGLIMVFFGKPLVAYLIIVVNTLVLFFIIFNIIFDMLPSQPKSIEDFIVVALIAVMSAGTAFVTGLYLAKVVLKIGPPILTAILFILLTKSLLDMLSFISSPVIKTGLQLIGCTAGLGTGYFAR
jgi:hypothetical protein